MDDAGTDAEIQTLMRLGAKYKWATGETRRRLEEAGVNLVRSDFYSESPLLSEIESSFEYRGSSGLGDTPAIFDDAAIFPEARLKAEAEDLIWYAAGFRPQDFGDADGFDWNNGQIAGNDVMALYAMIQRHKPRKVIEIGSGMSSHIARIALKDAGRGHLTCIDPEPRFDITQLEGIQFITRPVQEIPPSEIVADLSPGDIIFYDAEHSLKTGSSAVYFYLLLLPYLPEGVIVHVHDVRLPYPRNKEALMKAKLYWNEPYVVMAFLHDTRRYAVLFGSEYTARRFPDVAKAMMHGHAPHGGVSLWMEIRTPPPPLR